jgi:hypothetical protein
MPLVLLDIGKPEGRFSVVKFLEAKDLEGMKLELLTNPAKEGESEIVTVLDKASFAENEEEAEILESFNELIDSMDPEARKKFEFFLTVLFQYAEVLGFEEGRICVPLSNN